MDIWERWVADFARRHGLTADGQRELRTLLSSTTTFPQTPPSSAPDTWEPGMATHSAPTMVTIDGLSGDGAAVDSPPRRIGRYEVLSLLGVGGAGVVYRVWDPVMRRRLALKLLREDRAVQVRLQQRFIEEAKLTAQLDHPGVVPVYNLEQLADGRALFTMKEVQGETLRDVIRRSHPLQRQQPASTRQRLRHLIGALLRAGEAVAYAHSRGIIHRDLKPSNIMIGEFGQVLVLDWGLARPLALQADAPPPSLAGTPPYMPPEQAAGLPSALAPTADVYALGAVLYEILSGAAPFAGRANADILEQLQAGVSPEPPDAPVDAGALVDICQHAMRADPAARPGDAAAFTERVRDWLDGVLGEEQAAALIAEADALATQRSADLQASAALSAQASAALRALPPYAPIEDKRPGWALEDAAARRQRDAAGLTVRYEQLLQSALRAAPHLRDAHDRLAALYHEHHRSAEARGDHAEASGLATRIRAHDRGGRFMAYLSGEGSLSLQTDPPEADAVLYPFREMDRRLVLGRPRLLGRTPLVRLILEQGRYLLRLQAPGRAVTDLPLHITRGLAWRQVPPGLQSAQPVQLPGVHEVNPDVERYVPAGWFWCGGDERAQLALPGRRLWADGFIIQRFPVTNAEYLDFIHDLLAREGEAEALRWVPQERPGPGGRVGQPLYGRAADGGFALVADPDGDIWRPDEPVSYVDWHAAQRYAQWRAERDGVPWRLPLELEWEKAARGVDGRIFPWGDFADPTWSNNRLSSAQREVSTPVTRYPLDESPYGVRGMAGNLQDWCADWWRDDGPAVDAGGRIIPLPEPPPGENRRLLRGGTWATSIDRGRCGGRTVQPDTARDGGRGIRLVRSWSFTA